MNSQNIFTSACYVLGCLAIIFAFFMLRSRRNDKPIIPPAIAMMIWIIGVALLSTPSFVTAFSS